MTIDKNFCMSSFLAFRYIEKKDMDFYPGLQHHNILPVPDEERILVENVQDIDKAIHDQFNTIADKKLGILLSGGMDSAILASYMTGKDAYTFRFLNGDFQKEELKRAEYYASFYSLKLHYVDINWDTVSRFLAPVMINKCAPVHSIEPQLLQAALQAKDDGINLLIVGESSDLIFGGMDKLLAKDWTLEEFSNRYTFTSPKDVLLNPIDMSYLYERYRTEDGKINFLRFMDEIFSIESSSSYLNAFQTAEMNYLDPYARLKMLKPLDLNRVRNGESKYLIRELFKLKYPNIPVPNKVPMPRPVDSYFADWEGPTRYEFKKDIDINKFTGNQKWQIYCLEKFLNMHEPIENR